MGLLSFFEHGRSVRPSTILTLYLLAAVLCDGINLSTLYQNHGYSPLIGLLAAVVGLKFLLLVVETQSKQAYLREPYKAMPVEQLVSTLSGVFLFWINGEILKGYSKLLSVSDLPALDDGLRSRHLRERMVAAWEKTGTFIIILDTLIPLPQVLIP